MYSQKPHKYNRISQRIAFELGEVEFDFSNPNICYGSKGGGGTNTTSTVTNSAPPQYVQDAYQALLAQGNQVASAPFSQPAQPVAGLSPGQTSAINTVDQSQGIANPFINAGAQYTAAGAAPVYGNLPQINAQTLSQYESPYQSQVVNATQAQLNQNDAVQQQQLMGNAIASGASPFGGDRAGVAAAALAGQQDLANNSTMANLNNQNYTQALNEANAQQQLQASTQESDAWRQLSAGTTLPQTGTTAENDTLQGASSQLQTGGIEQQLEQEMLNSPYQEQLAQLAYPFQTTNFLSGLTEGIGSGSGGTGTGTTTTPGASTASQVAGLGLTGLALNQSLPAGSGIMSMLGGAAAAKTGGRIQHKATGGGIAIPQIGANNQISYVSAPTSQGGIGGMPVSAPSGGPTVPQVGIQPQSTGIAPTSTIPANLMQNYAPSGTSALPAPATAQTAALATQPSSSTSQYGNQTPLSILGGPHSADLNNLYLNDATNPSSFLNTPFSSLTPQQQQMVTAAKGQKHGGIAHFDGGGVTGSAPYGVPVGDIVNVPDVAVSVVGTPLSMKAGNGPPSAQAPKGSDGSFGSSSPLSGLTQGAGLGNLLGGLSANSGSGIIPGSAGDAGSAANTDSLLGGTGSSVAAEGGDSAGTSLLDSSSFLDAFKKGGAVQRRAIGGQVLPDVLSGIGDIVGAFFGMPTAGDMGVGVLSAVDGGRTEGEGVEGRALGSIEGQGSTNGGTGFRTGGIAGHYDSGGMITSPAQASIAGSSPQIQQQASQYNNLPLDKLEQLAVMQPTNPLIQRALQMKKMGAGAAGSNQQPTASNMRKGGIAGYDDGGYVNDAPATQVLQDIADNSSPPAPPATGIGASDIDVSQIPPVNDSDMTPPDDAKGIAPAISVKTSAAQDMEQPENQNLDAKPVVDHSGDTVKIHYPSEKTSLDTGIPTYKDSSVSSSAWEPLLAAGLGMMAGTSPHALVNIGRGGLEGLQAAGSQRAANLKENEAQNEAQQEANKLTQQQSQFDTKQNSLSAYEKAELDTRNQQLAQDKWQIIPDQMGGFVKYNKKTGETQAVAGANGSAMPALDPKTGQPLTGDAYLATLPPENAAQIKAMDEGRLNFPAGFALKSPYWQQKLSQLYQYNPEASQQTAAAVKAFNQGSQGNQMRSLNVAVNHLDTLSQLTDAMNNGDVKALNTVSNAWKSQTGSPAPNNFNTAKQVVADEVTKAVIGAGGTGADRDKAQAVIDNANSPEQLKGAIQTYKSLMTGQLGGLKQQYEVSTGRKDFDKYLTPAAKTALMPAQPSSGTQSTQSVQPPVAGAQKAPDGNWYVHDPNRQGKYLMVQ